MPYNVNNGQGVGRHRRGFTRTRPIGSPTRFPMFSFPYSITSGSLWRTSANRLVSFLWRRRLDSDRRLPRRVPMCALWSRLGRTSEAPPWRGRHRDAFSVVSVIFLKRFCGSATSSSALRLTRSSWGWRKDVSIAYGAEGSDIWSKQDGLVVEGHREAQVAVPVPGSALVGTGCSTRRLSEAGAEVTIETKPEPYCCFSLERALEPLCLGVRLARNGRLNDNRDEEEDRNQW